MRTTPTACAAVGRLARLAIISVLLLASCGRSTRVPDWCKGGTLHASTLREWRAASDANRLATAADFVAGIFKDDRLSMTEIRTKAEDLVRAIAPSAATADLGNMKTTEVAAAAMVLLGWKSKR